MAGNLGVRIELRANDRIEELPADILMFSESNGRFIVTTSADRVDDIESCFAGLSCRRIGNVTSEQELIVSYNDELVVSATINELRDSFKKGLADA
jgi:phosphoribosylformylglycinamidine synthase